MTAVRVLLILMSLGLLACSTPETTYYSDPRSYDDSNMNPYAYDSFVVERPMPIRRANDFQFYYKHCKENTNRADFSPHTYHCTSSLF